MGSDSRMHPLRLGDRGSAVADVQVSLRILGLLADDASPAAGSDGEGLDAAVFDDSTERAVRHFQQVRGLSVDGRVGDET